LPGARDASKEKTAAALPTTRRTAKRARKTKNTPIPLEPQPASARPEADVMSVVGSTRCLSRDFLHAARDVTGAPRACQSPKGQRSDNPTTPIKGVLAILPFERQRGAPVDALGLPGPVGPHFIESLSLYAVERRVSTHVFIPSTLRLAWQESA